MSSSLDEEAAPRRFGREDTPAPTRRGDIPASGHHLMQPPFLKDVGSGARLVSVANGIILGCLSEDVKGKFLMSSHPYPTTLGS